MFGVLKDFVRLVRVLVVRLVVRRKVFDFATVDGKSMVVAPHPDDEVLGCAGLVQRLSSAGRQVDVVILSGGGRSHAGCCGIDEAELIETRRQLSRRAAEILGLPPERLHFLDYPDGSIAFDNAETGRFRQLMAELNPDAVFVPHRGEGWSDHLAAADIARRLTEGDKAAARVFEYCVWFWYYNTWNIDWRQARVLKMTPEENMKKQQAIDAYVKPLAPCGRPWSGVLPRVFVNACRWNKELYFEAEK